MAKQFPEEPIEKMLEHLPPPAPDPRTDRDGRLFVNGMEVDFYRIASVGQRAFARGFADKIYGRNPKIFKKDHLRHAAELGRRFAIELLDVRNRRRND